jgi:hypothetical protein
MRSISHLGSKPPPRTQSRQLGHQPPQCAYQPQPTHYLHHHHQSFACAGDIERARAGSAIWGQNPLPPLDLTNRATDHLNAYISLSLHTTSTTTANHLHMQAILSKHARCQPWGVKIPYPHSISPTRPLTTSMRISTSAYTLPQPPLPIVCMHRQY